MYKTTLLSVIIFLLFTGCDTNDEHVHPHTVYDRIVADKKNYVDFDRFKEGRPCGEVKFMCLPESRDKSWQSVPTKDRIEDFELTPEVMRKRQAIVQRWRDEEDGKVKEQGMKLSQISEEFYDRVEERKFLEEMEQDLEKEFPGFWRGVPKKVRYRWIRRAMNKAKVFGYDPKKNNAIVELCARIGLDFNKDPKWEYITRFIRKKERYIRLSIHYIDYTIFNKAYYAPGQLYTDWHFREAFPDLPKPKRPLPKLHEQ
ncbi:hypothetical protein [Hydrogenimonas sp.]